MLTRETSREMVDIPFQKTYFFSFIAASSIFFILGYWLFVAIPEWAFWGLLFMIMVSFTPTAIAFDLFQLYNEELSIPKLRHPKRMAILAMNIFLGWTIIGWFITLKMALTPGSVMVDKVKYVDSK